jgi:pyrroloquinoline-quinone synthase
MREQYPWIAEEGFTYFTTRLEVIAGEGKSTLDLVVQYCETREQQETAIAALSFKCDVLWAILDAVDYYAVGGADNRTTAQGQL